MLDQTQAPANSFFISGSNMESHVFEVGFTFNLGRNIILFSLYVLMRGPVVAGYVLSS